MTTSSPRSAASDTTAATSSREGTAPVGLPGLQSRSAAARGPERALDGPGIPAPSVVGVSRHVDGHGSGRADRALEEEAGRRHDDLVPGAEERAEADPERVHGAVRDEDLRLRHRRRGRSTARSSPAYASRSAVRPRGGGGVIGRPSTVATASTTCVGSAGEGVPASGTGSTPAARAASSCRSASKVGKPPAPFTRERPAARRARDTGPCAARSAGRPPSACRCRRPRRC